MQVHRGLDGLPSLSHTVITLGMFDGVHVGHRGVLGIVREQALAAGRPSVVITFADHPQSTVNPQTAPKLLTTLDEKIDRIAHEGIDHLVVLHFDVNFAGLSPEEYIRNFLVRHFQPSVIISGFDHRFGRDRQGDFALLQAQSSKYGYRVVQIEPQLESALKISSTRIRHCLQEGDVTNAALLLGYSPLLGGTVVHGDGIGHTLGYATANLEVDPNKLLPADGVYAVRTNMMDKEPGGLLSIGTRPTLGKGERKVEVHVLDFNADLYGQYLEVALIAHLRGQKRFESLQDLQTAMQADEAEARRLLRQA